jgi:glycosyltransferase involved in cell wall biosynthesis
MFQTTESRNGAGTAADTDAPETRDLEARNGHHQANGKPHHRLGAALPPAAKDGRPVVAMFCYEGPEGAVGRFVYGLAGALARRGHAVHLFTRDEFDPDGDVFVHGTGDCDEGDIIDQVQEFTRRACNNYLKQFPAGGAPVAVMGFEWSAVPAVSILRGIKNLDVLLSLHSVERQRGDVSSDLSKRIEEIELSGLREAKRVLAHGEACAAAVRQAAPECADRITTVYPMFPAHEFEPLPDPGQIKARYQVGPVDPTIVYVGDLSDRYGPDLLVRAMPGILKNHRQARLIVVGDGDLQWPLRVYARYLLLEHAVRLPGSVVGQDLRDLIRAADVVAVPSRDQTPWWPIQAAWAAGRPVVATHQAAPGLMSHEQDGVMVYPSENSLVWGIERVLYDAGLRDTMALKGAAKLDDRFGWGAVAAQVEGLLSIAQAR